MLTRLVDYFLNLLNGKKFSIPNAHDKEEITYCILDQAQRTLFTGAKDGTIKAWNVTNGQFLQHFEPTDDLEVTGLTVIDRKRMLISVGINKKIVTYNDITFDVRKLIKLFKIFFYCWNFIFQILNNQIILSKI